MRLTGTVAAFLALVLAVAVPADAARHPPGKRHRPLCNPRGTKILAKRTGVRILYVERPDDSGGIYGKPATVYACFPQKHQRVKLFELDRNVSWSPQLLRLTPRYFAYYATTEDIACEKYQQDNCFGSEVAVWALAHGHLRCMEQTYADALALTSNGWIAWRVPGASAAPPNLRACDSAGARQLDSGNIDAASLGATGSTVTWSRDGQPYSAELR